MKHSKTLLVLLGLACTGLANAECSIELPYPQLVDCIVEEGASDRYRPEDNESSQARATGQEDNNPGQKLSWANKVKKVN